MPLSGEYGRNGGQVSLDGWSHLRQAGRIFRLDRIERATLTTWVAGSHDVDETLGWTPGQLASP